MAIYGIVPACHCPQQPLSSIVYPGTMMYAASIPSLSDRHITIQYIQKSNSEFKKYYLGLDLNYEVQYTRMQYSSPHFDELSSKLTAGLCNQTITLPVSCSIKPVFSRATNVLINQSANQAIIQ